MVALLVLALGLLGFAAMQARGISQGQKAYYHSQAMFVAQDIVERMRANPTVLASYVLDFEDAPSGGGNCRSAPCSPAALAAWDKVEWLNLVRDSLPQGAGQVQMVATGDPTTVLVSVRYLLNRDLASDPEANQGLEGEYVYELRTHL